MNFQYVLLKAAHTIPILKGGAQMQTSNSKQRDKELEESFEICNAASTTDCTGLVFVSPHSDSEWDSYVEVYHFQPVAVTKKRQD